MPPKPRIVRKNAPLATIASVPPNLPSSSNVQSSMGPPPPPMSLATPSTSSVPQSHAANAPLQRNSTTEATPAIDPTPVKVEETTLPPSNFTPPKAILEREMEILSACFRVTSFLSFFFYFSNRHSVENCGEDGTDIRVLRRCS